MKYQNLLKSKLFAPERVDKILSGLEYTALVFFNLISIGTGILSYERFINEDYKNGITWAMFTAGIQIGNYFNIKNKKLREKSRENHLKYMRRIDDECRKKLSEEISMDAEDLEYTGRLENTVNDYEI